MRVFFACLLLCLSITMVTSPTAAAAGEETVKQTDAAALRAKIMTCFLPSAASSGRVVVAFEIDQTGAVKTAHVVEGGETDGEKALASAGIRAIFRCGPYQPSMSGRIKLPFEMPDTPPSGLGAAAAALSAGMGKTAGYDEKRIRSVTLAGVPLRFEAPEGFCPVDPQGRSYDRYLWRHFKPDDKRNANMVDLEFDCETVAEGRRSGQIWRPKRIFMVSGAERDVDLPADLGGFLAVLLDRLTKREPLTNRFWQKPPIAGSPVTGVDEYAVYVAHREVAKDGRINVAGLSTFTLIHDRQLIMSHFEFDGRDLAGDMPGGMMRATASLHDLSP